MGGGEAGGMGLAAKLMNVLLPAAISKGEAKLSELNEPDVVSADWDRRGIQWRSDEEHQKWLNKQTGTSGTTTSTAPTGTTGTPDTQTTQGGTSLAADVMRRAGADSTDPYGILSSSTKKPSILG